LIGTFYDTPPACDNGLFCDGTKSCNEATDSCDPGTPVVCDDGVFCDGAESRDEGSDICVPGLPPNLSTSILMVESRNSD
jgi:hypothetical protein